MCSAVTSFYKCPGKTTLVEANSLPQGKETLGSEILSIIVQLTKIRRKPEEMRKGIKWKDYSVIVARAPTTDA